MYRTNVLFILFVYLVLFLSPLKTFWPDIEHDVGCQYVCSCPAAHNFIWKWRQKVKRSQLSNSKFNRQLLPQPYYHPSFIVPTNQKKFLFHGITYDSIFFYSVFYSTSRWNRQSLNSLHVSFRFTYQPTDRPNDRPCCFPLVKKLVRRMVGCVP